MFTKETTVMRLYCFLAGMWVLMAGCSEQPVAPNGDDTTEVAAIRTLLMKQQAHWNEGDIEAFMEEAYLRSDSLRFVGSTGEILGYDNILERYRRAYPDRSAMGHLTFELRAIDVLGPKHAAVFGAYALQRETDTPTGLFTLILTKTEHGWRIVHDHTSADEA